MSSLKTIWWVIIFITRLRFPPGLSIATILVNSPVFIKPPKKYQLVYELN